MFPVPTRATVGQSRGCACVWPSGRVQVLGESVVWKDGAGAGVGAWACGVQALAPELPPGFLLPPASVGSLVFIL